MRERVEEVMNEIRPMLQADGGDVELVDVTEEGVVKVRLTEHLRRLSHVPDHPEQRNRETAEGSGAGGPARGVRHAGRVEDGIQRPGWGSTAAGRLP